MHVALVSAESFYDNALALEYLACFAAARPSLAGVSFQIEVQSDGRTEEEFFQAILLQKPDVVGFNSYVWNVDLSVKLARRIKEIRPSTVIIFGGMEATFSAAKWMAEVREIDFIVVGEGEIAFADLLEGVLQGRRYSGAVAGLAYRKDDGTPVVGALAPVIQNLDEIPSPFSGTRVTKTHRKRVLYESYRGCAFHCAFCLYQRSYASQRYFSLERVKADLSAILASGVSHLRFVDSTFNLHKTRTKEILQFLAGSKVEVLVEVSAEFFDAEMISLLADAGIKHIDIGLQSTHDQALKAINREWYRQDKFSQNLQLLRDDPRLTLNVELIAGLPGDDWSGLMQSINDAVNVWPDHVSIYRLLGLRGTAMVRDQEKTGLRFSDSPPYELLESSSFSSETLSRADEVTFAHMVVFNLGIGRFALKHACRFSRALPTAIYDRFLSLVFHEQLYSQAEVRHLGRFHGYGNRFDQPMPDGFDPKRIKAALEAFFSDYWSSDASAAAVALELIDFGYELALLDRVQRDHGNDHGSPPKIAPWCRSREYGLNTLNELAEQGNAVSTMPSEEIASVVFVIHPELGPAALAVDHATREILASGVSPEDFPQPVQLELRKVGVMI